MINIYMYHEIRLLSLNFFSIYSNPDVGSCPIRRMDGDQSTTVVAACGVILSPRLPGLVEPGQWSWILQAPAYLVDAYLAVYVHYVRGPAISDDCSQYFQCKRTGIIKKGGGGGSTFCSSLGIIARVLWYPSPSVII